MQVHFLNLLLLLSSLLLNNFSMGWCNFFNAKIKYLFEELPKILGLYLHIHDSLTVVRDQMTCS